MRAWLLPSLLLAGCTDAGVGDDAGDVTPVPYVLDEEDPPAAAMSTGALADAVEAAVARATSLSVTPVFDAYAAAVEGRDDRCPAWAEEGEASQWYGSCVADSGTRFDGFGGVQTYEGYGEGGDPEWAVSMYASATIATSTGHTFQGGGGVYAAGGTNADGTWGYDSISGAFRWDGPEAMGTWLADGTEADLARYWSVASWGQVVQLGGSVVASDGTPVAFDALTLISTVCPGEPAGTVSVRGDDGWYDVIFDLDLEEEMDPALCDGCGTAWFRGERLGQVCVSLADYAAFEGTPW